MSKYLKSFLMFYLRFIFLTSIAVCLLTLLILLIIRRFSVETFLNLCFIEATAFMVLSGIMAIGVLSRISVKMDFSLFGKINSKEPVYSIALSWVFFSFSATMFIILFIIHFTSKAFL